MNNQFTEQVTDLIQLSKEEAVRLGNSSVAPEHLLLGILRHGDNLAFRLLRAVDVEPDELKHNVESQLLSDRSDSHIGLANMKLNEVSERILNMSLIEANLLNDKGTEAHHILLAIMRDGNNGAYDILDSMYVSHKLLWDLVKSVPEIKSGLNYDDDDDKEEEDDDLIFENVNKNANKSRFTDKQNKTQKQVNGGTPTIDRFSTDLTAAAQEGKLDPVVGREKEIERIAQILSRRKKNNPVLIGEPGVGKSAIVEGLAQRIVERKVSRLLAGKRVVALDMTAIVAGTKYRGEFEERMQNILKELKANRDLIVFIDEIHTMVGAGAAAGSMDAANIFKPALARGEIQCIGSTTLDEYHKSIEKDTALERRFQKVIVNPTTEEETMQILKNIKDKYEDHHNVTYTDEALMACVKLTGRYVTDRFFPDKAIDALDEAGSRVHLLNFSTPKEIEEFENKLDAVRQKKNDAVHDQDFESAANFRDKEKKMMEKLDNMREEWEETMKQNREKVDEKNIADVVAMISGVPVQRVAESENSRLRNMKDNLMKSVIAQDKAVETLVKSIMRNRVGLKDPNKPIGTFLFLGPTGVGKTHLAKQLAKEMFGTTDALIRIDMSEYMEKYTVSKLIGSAPGYVGYGEGGHLTEQVRRKPYSIVLFDEIEKAHQDVFNIFLQMMDEGRLTDSEGRTVDFRNTIIIMTSNVGTKQLKEFGKGIGFSAGMKGLDNEYSRSVITKALNKTFSPEFLNRLDEIITFDQLDEEALNKIVDIELKALYSRIEGLGYKLVIDDSAKRFVAKNGYDPQFGARPLKRSIQNNLEDSLAELIINVAPVQGMVLHVSMKPEEKALDLKVED